MAEGEEGTEVVDEEAVETEGVEVVVEMMQGVGIGIAPRKIIFSFHPYC